jgi:hypothetical protein
MGVAAIALSGRATAMSGEPELSNVAILAAE